MAKLPQDDAVEAYTTAEIERKFKISDVTIRKFIANGTFRARKIGSGSSSKWIISARSVHAWLHGEENPTEPAPTPIAPHREIIALSSIPYMSQEERVELEMRRESGELVVAYFDRLPALVPAETIRQ